MLSLPSLWLPILLSAVFVFVASGIIHMVLKYHNSDYRQLANEDEVRDAIRKTSPAPGQYVLPYCADMKEMGGEAMKQKYTDGPLGFLTLRPNGVPKMGPSFISWFLFTVAVSLFAAYIGHVTLPEKMHYLTVFRVVGTATFMAYGLGALPGAIWMGRPWSAVLKDLADAIIYALLTAGTFGWLWPR
ncbi:MAG: hypothetical protein IPQ13_14625 [Holophagaceae bacterium]|nr:hypothetical protein [Holophagaceae bacterium]